MNSIFNKAAISVKRSIMIGTTVTMRNRPFYRYGDYIELIRFKDHYGMPRGHGHDPVSSFGIYARFSGQFFIKFSQSKIVMGKKIFVP